MEDTEKSITAYIADDGIAAEVSEDGASASVSDDSVAAEATDEDNISAEASDEAITASVSEVVSITSGGTSDHSSLLNLSYEASGHTGFQKEISESNKLDYSFLKNTPSIPSKTSDISNDSGYITSAYHDASKYDASNPNGYVTEDYHDPAKYDASNPNGYTSNTGTVISVSVKMNGETKGTVTSSGEINLGTVITEHQSLSGYATLVDGKVPASQLPSYVDDVLEYASKDSFPSEGESGKIYVSLDTNLTYRWSGSAYVEISPSLALGETASTAYPGNKGKANADAIAELGDASKKDVDSSISAASTSTNLPTSAAVASFVSEMKGTGTVTSVSVKMNNETKGTVTTSGEIDLGTVVTSTADCLKYNGDGIYWQVNGGGSYDYCLIAQLKVNAWYTNYPIMFELCGRGLNRTFVQVTFGSTDTLDPALKSFSSYKDNTHYFICRVAEGTWNIYGEYTEAWGGMMLLRVYGPGMLENRLIVTLKMENVSSLPEGYVMATKEFAYSTDVPTYSVDGTTLTITVP